MSVRETAIAALTAAVTASVAAVPPAAAPPVLREEPMPQRIPPQGILWVLDGASVEETPIMSPYRVQVMHEAQVVLFAAGKTIAARQALLDALLVKVSAAVTGDRTLGGAVEWAGVGSPAFEDVEWEGAEPARAATVPVTLMFTAAGSPLA